MDCVSEVDGLERLICVCIALDTRQDVNADGANDAVRSRLYRGFTRAQMQTMIVNEVRNRLFDNSKTLRVL